METGVEGPVVAVAVVVASIVVCLGTAVSVASLGFSFMDSPLSAPTSMAL